MISVLVLRFFVCFFFVGCVFVLGFYFEKGRIWSWMNMEEESRMSWWKGKKMIKNKLYEKFKTKTDHPKFQVSNV